MKKLIIIIISILITVQCTSKRMSFSNAVELYNKKDSIMISDYEKKCMQLKGKMYFFIPKEEINSIIKTCCYGDSIKQKNVKVNDIVFFINKEGDVVYQSIVSKIENDRIFIECLNLTTFNKYETVLCSDSIIDLQRNYPYLIRLYRSK